MAQVIKIQRTSMETVKVVEATRETHLMMTYLKTAEVKEVTETQNIEISVRKNSMSTKKKVIYLKPRLPNGNGWPKSGLRNR